LLTSAALGVLVLFLMAPSGYVHVKLVIAAGAFLLVGLWRLLRVPLWIRRPDEVERFECSRKRVQIIMRGGRLYEVAVSGEEQEELELAIRQRADEIRLRAYVIRQ